MYQSNFNKKRGLKQCFRTRSIVLRPNCRKPPAPSAVVLPALATNLAVGHPSSQQSAA
jgi:hypothetical protein